MTICTVPGVHNEFTRKEEARALGQADVGQGARTREDAVLEQEGNGLAEM